MIRENHAAIRVVLFSGGRGSRALLEFIAADPRVDLTLAINGYDDGASTGAVRQFLGDALGPSDFRKNAARCARLRRTCPTPLLDLLDRRLSEQATGSDVIELAVAARDAGFPLVERRLRRFEAERTGSARPMALADASVGNLVFAGGFLESGRRFNAAVNDYCALVGLPEGVIENVSDGTNAFLVALDDQGRLLGSEAEIVDASHPNTVGDIFLLDHPLDGTERDRLSAMPQEARREALAARAIHPPLNPKVSSALEKAHLIIFAPGTQHSSLLPSYLTAGLGEAIAANLTAIKLLVTNIQEDAEITGRSAVELIDRAVFYLRDKGRLRTPAPCLITHSLLNDPARTNAEAPYVPLGRLESLEDPRLIRIANYEAGSTGRHDATKVLAPYLDGLVARAHAVQRVAVVLAETQSPNKIAQTLLEMVRGDVTSLPIALEVFHSADAPLDPDFLGRLPFAVRALPPGDATSQDRDLRMILRQGPYDFVVLFDSSGMYNGEDIGSLASHLTLGRLDAVWGSRRLSLRDIQESYRVRYRGNALRGAVSAFGSHVLSLQFLALFGRYVSDTLSGARAVRAADVLSLPCLLSDAQVNQYLLSALLRRRAEMLEVPVQFFAISPDQVRRTSVTDGFKAMLVALRQRF
jgi:2-phospho-L-lactate transferase/gluconeogenesis factor (CofD/UPF0052 family)